MYRSKKDVDKHVENLTVKLSVKEFKTRAYSIARLYYEVGDYASCQRYVEQYLTQKDNNAAAYKLLGQALLKLGQKEKALEQFKTSLDIDPTQTSTILDICELLVDDEVSIDPGRARYWCEKAEAIFPRHPVTFRLRERLVIMSNPDSEALVELLIAELAVRPMDPILHSRLLRHYLHTNQIKKAIDHSCNVEFGGNTFHNNFAWYETLAELLKHNSHNANDWLYQLLLLTVRERMCVLSLTETPSGPSKSLVESNELLFIYDQDIENIAKAGATPGFGDFHASLLQHHRGQFAFHSATFLLKKAKKDQMTWRDASQFAAPLMLISWHSTPIDTKANWLNNAPKKQQEAVNRWYSEGTYRCSQSGHYLISNSQDRSQTFLDRISQCCSGTYWRDKIYEKIFTNRGHLSKLKSSHFTASNAFITPTLRLPRRVEVETIDVDAQRECANSLHHFVWILLNYKNLSHFKCSLFDTLTPSASNYGPESLNKFDVQAFLYFAALTSKQQKSKDLVYLNVDKPVVIPANITDLLCLIPQLKWWELAYLFSQNKLGADLTDIRSTLSRGIEVVRCIDNHGLDPELLCTVAHIFSERAKLTTAVEEKNNLVKRAGVYYSAAIPLLEKIKSRIIIKLPEKRLFDYTHKELNTKELNSLIEESKLFVALNHINDCEYVKAIELLSDLKSPEAFYHLSQTYRKIALEENSPKDKYISLLSKARVIAYQAMESLKQSEMYRNSPLFAETQELIDDLETMINKLDPDLSSSVIHDADGKYSSDENVSLVGSEQIPHRSNNIFKNLSSTPKLATNRNVTNYRTAVDSHILESTQIDHRHLERIETEIKNLQKRDTTMNDFMEQTKKWFDENRKLGKEIISTIHTNIQNTTDQFKLLKISVDNVKDQVDECRNECKDMGELKKQIAEMKKEINKLKKTSSEQNINDNDLYNLENEYRSSESANNFTTQLQFAPQVMPPFNQRIMPPFPVPHNPYQLYGQNLYNLYNQYSQFGQTPQVPGAPPIFDPTRGQMNYPGVYPTPDSMYLDVTQLVAPTVPAVPIVSSVATPVVPTLPSASTIPAVSSVTAPSVNVGSASKPAPMVHLDSKEIPRSLPVNVVITSSDPLPTCTTTPAPILSVTIPSKHIKGTPHNYQITMPSTTDSKVVAPPVFSFPSSVNKFNVNNIGNSLNNWSQSSVFKSTNATNESYSTNISDILDNSKSVVDGIFSVQSPNTSLNKSRTLSERSNTSVENYDPCPDFKPIIPLPDEVKVTTGEEDESVIFSSRAKLFRFVDKQWKERGIGEMKLLKHKNTGKVRVLMRREQIHKICANHIITTEMEIKPMKNETKAYFWVANDFADETVVLEKFCIRFKTADIALQFYNKFEEARIDSSSTILVADPNVTRDPVAKISNLSSTPIKSDISSSNTSQINKPGYTVGGFTFSSTPTFKPVQEVTKTEIQKDSPSTKTNIFSGLSFKTNASSPFTNIFDSQQLVSKPSSNINEIPQEQDVSNKLNNSDIVEEFEPNVEFKPVVPLPALVDHKTGEEDEIILFEHRAKLLRFDAATKEWKERGLGNIKLLVHKDNSQKVRLLMRREQIMKVCCNLALTKEMTFQKMPNIDKAVTWCAKDFSEGELIAETFCLRFKTVQTCDAFIEAVKSAQSKMSDNTKAAKEEQNAAKQSTQAGFGDKFKPKPGSWHCETCYTNNLEDYNKCACCEQPKPQSSVTVSSTTTKSVFSTPTAVITASPASWGDAFKPRPGSWECQNCLVRNEGAAENCTACSNPKEPSGKKPGFQPVNDNTMKFKFGMPTTTAVANTQPQITATKIGWGDKFKPKEGTWECKQCLVRNEENLKNCSACSSPKDPNAPKESKSILSSINLGPKFNFGIPAETTGNEQAPGQKASIFDGTGAHKFKFGVPSTQENSASILTFDGQKAPLNKIFETPKLAADSEGALNFSVKKNEETDKNKDNGVLSKPSLLPTPQDGTLNNSLFRANESGTFGFVFKPKTPPKGKSPIKSPKGQKGDESDDNEYASEDEGHHIHFSPVIPMPDKVEVVTGEENEDELYEHRAKLFIFTNGEWKERGIGVVKVLKHKDTGKLRVVMRREQVHKICLNHALTPEIIYTPKDEKTWLFAANDFSEGEIKLQNFCLRFKNKEIATEFKSSVDKARHGSSERSTKSDNESSKKDTESDDIVFVSEIQATAEEKQKAKELMLPENFFTYKVKEPCQGCRGCTADDEDPKSRSTVPATLAAVTTVTSTPVKVTTPAFHSPATSLYGTPANFDRTVDVSVFRTPLGAIGSNTKSITPTSAESNVTITNDTDKENSFVQKSSIFGGGEKKTLFATPQTKTTSTFSGTDTLTPVSTKTSIIAPPKLSTVNTSGDEQLAANPKFIFETAQKNSLFASLNPGTSVNKSIFSFSSVDKKEVSDKPDVKSLFGGDDQKPLNLFSGVSQGSLFGPGSLTNAQTKPVNSIFGASGISLFGSNVSAQQPQVFGNGSSIFSTKQPWTAGTAVEQTKPDITISQESNVKPNNDTKIDTPFKVDNTLTFAALSSGGPGFNKQKNTDFKWEGAGQQLFTTATEAGDKSKNDSGAGADEANVGADEEYDPHYEAIVPLPDKIVVTTGEEDEEKLFGERGKLYRYDDKTREWKERGVGEMKILYHPERKTYRLLLRREQVHKAVLNMLIFMDLELLPMKNTDRAWTWAGINYAETAAGEQETLAIKFKSLDLTTSFRDKVVECVRKLQASAAQVIRETKEEKHFSEVAPLRLPKHLADSARADTAISARSHETTEADNKSNGDVSKSAEVTEVYRQVHFQEPVEEEDHEEEDDGYEHDYEHHDDYDGYYNEEEDESGVYYACDGAAEVRQGSVSSNCDNAHVQVLYDQDIYSPKILVTDADTGEILADMLIHTDTEFQMSGDSCSWSGIDYTSNVPVDKTVTINFHDSDTAMQFYDSCETSKAATYSSTDPES